MPYLLLWIGCVVGIQVMMHSEITILLVIVGFTGLAYWRLRHRFIVARWCLLLAIGLIGGGLSGATLLFGDVPVGSFCEGYVTKIYDKGLSVSVDRCRGKSRIGGYIYLACWGKLCPGLYTRVEIQVTNRERFGKFFSRGKAVRVIQDQSFLRENYYRALRRGDEFRRGYLDWQRETLPAEHAGFLVSMLFGETGLTGELKESMKNIGIVHIIAISGINIRYLQDLAGWVTKRLRKRVRSVFDLFLLVSLFVAVGPAVSLFRSIVMVLVVRLNSFLGMPKSKALFITGISVLIMLDPWLIFDAGYWLVTAACFGIYIAVPYVTRSFKNQAMVVLIESVVIWGCVAPIQWLIFGEITPLGIAAGLILGPFVEVATMLGYVGVLARYIPYIGEFLRFVNGILMILMVWVVNLFHGAFW